MSEVDLVIRGGTIVDGNGGEPFVADLAVRDGRIVALGEVAARGCEEIDATGLLVTPGFVDVHTHYDGQMTWENRTLPSAAHGVTTVLMGNCGVGFAPCRPEDRDTLIHLMEGIEDIPELVMAEGLPWNWQTFPEYLDVVASRPRDIDVAAQLPHSCLRVFVMGERGARGEAATADDLAQMTRLTEEAVRAGALGFGTSRTLFHRSSDGMAVPTKDAAEVELDAIAQGLARAGAGIIQVALDFLDADTLESDIRMIGRVAKGSGRPASFNLVQLPQAPEAWRRALSTADEIVRSGVPMKAQVLGRPTGLLLGLELSYNPFSLYPSYRKIADLPLEQRVAEMRKPEVRARILSESRTGEAIPTLDYLTHFDRMFPLGDPPNYEPPLESSIVARAAREGRKPEEVVYDALLEQDGHAIMMLAFANYSDGDLEVVRHMLRDDNTIFGLGDGGAHYGMICDAGIPTYMLTHWTRDRTRGPRLGLAEVVRGLTRDPAELIGLLDRGVVAPGYKADLNLIDYDRLRLNSPSVIRDLPAGGKRIIQRAEGYVATIVNGVVTQRDGEPTDHLPGRLVRGPRVAPVQ
nr:amidohydrolase family protein [Sphingomonas sp. Y57]